MILRVLVPALALLGAQDMGPFRECAERLEQKPEIYDSWFCFYRVAEQTGRWDDGEERLRNSAPADNGFVDIVLGHFVRRRGEIDGALELYRGAASRFQELGHFEGEVTARTNLRSVLSLYGRAEEAKQELSRLVEVAEKSTDPLLLAQAYQLQAHDLIETGQDIARAHRLLKRAEALLPDDGPYRIRRSVVLGLGNASFELGHYEEALDSYRELDRISGEAGNTYTQASAQYSIANTRLSQLEVLPSPGGLEEVAELAGRAVETSVAGQNPHAEVFALRTLGEVLGSLPGRREEAMEHLDRCSKLAESIGRPMEVAHCLWTRARHLADIDPSAARAVGERAIEVALEADNPEGLIRALSERMRISWKTEYPESAVQSSLRTLSAIEALRALQDERGARARVFSVWADDYYRLAGQLLEVSDPEAAFDVIERQRGRVLLESLVAAEAYLPPPASDRRLRALERIVAVQKELLTSDVSDRKRGELLRQLESVELEEQEARGAMGSPELEFATVHDVRQELAPNEALLSFQVGLWKDLYGEFGGGAFALVVTKDEVRVARIPDRTRLQPAVSIFVGALERRDGADLDLGPGLYGELLREALEKLPSGVDRLVIVPDGVLYDLPFDALRAGANESPLGARFEMQSVPSATLWLRWRRERNERAERPALALADPALPAASESPSVERNAVLSRGLELGPLPHARKEGRRLVRHLGGSSELRLSEKASEVFVKGADLRKYGVLHFAAHAIADEAHPERSAVLLFPGSDDEDGLLQAREIAELDLEGRIVVLSACRTASGSVLRGEGMLSLSRAFFEAGARAVVGSRWPLRDDEAEVLFDSFYRELRSGASVAASLRASKRAALEAGIPAIGWSSLVVLGDGGVAPFPGGLPPPGFESWPLVMIFLVLTAASLWSWRRFQLPPNRRTPARTNRKLPSSSSTN